MPVKTVVPRIADMVELITASDINPIRAYDTQPRSLNDADLPCLVISTAGGEYNITQLSEEIVQERRTYRLTLFVFKISLGEPGLAEEKVRPYIDAFRDYFLARPGLELDTDTPPRGLVSRAIIERDSGVTRIQYTQSEGYAGVTFDLRVEEVYAIGYTGG